MDERVERSGLLYERALFEGDTGALAAADRELDDARREGEALLWVGCFHQLVRRDNAVAVPVLQQSLELAKRTDDKGTMAEDLRHLGIADHRAGRLDSARQHLEESSRLWREIGRLPGVALNLVGLTYIAGAQGRRDDAMALIEEARAIAEASGAHGIMRHIEVARSRL